MKKVLLLFVTFLLLQGCSKNNIKTAYLEDNRFDLNEIEFKFPQRDFKILGFGSYHGSAKTEKAEFALLKSLTKEGTIKYYIPETDFSIAHYFNEYLKLGDTVLLKKLVFAYGAMVSQDKSIETFEKWKNLRILNESLETSKKFKVIGIDIIVNYEFTSKHLLELLDTEGLNTLESFNRLENMVRIDTTDYSPHYNSYSKKVLTQFVNDYENKKILFNEKIKDTFVFEHIIENIKQTFIDFDNSAQRELLIFKNYMHLSTAYNFDAEKQFLRYGFFHLEKEREGSAVPFFRMLIENDVYKTDEIVSIIGYLTQSEVLWDIIYEDGIYKSYTTEAGFGIGDYDKEYFLGIENLKETKISDMTLYRLNKENTPYNDEVPDLIEIVMEDDPSNGKAVKGKSTADFLDYAVLISNSKANVPIEEIDFKKK